MSSYEAHSHSDSTGDLDGNMESCIAPVVRVLSTYLLPPILYLTFHTMENVRQTRKNDTETQDDMAIWSFPSPEVSMISACPLQPCG